MPLINVSSVDELEEEKRNSEDSYPQYYVQAQPRIRMLAGHIRTDWDRAKTAKQPEEDKMLDSKRSRNGEYSYEHLQAIQSLHGKGYKPVWMNITETKCRAAVSWAKDIIFQPGIPPFMIKPTPWPELPREVRAELETQAMQTLIQKAGTNGDIATIFRQLDMRVPEMERALLVAMKMRATESAELNQLRIYDQLIEGGWFEALHDELNDIVTYGTAIHKGPFVRSDLVRTRVFNRLSGRFDPVIEERILARHGRVNPLMFYPGADNIGFSDGPTCEKMSLSRIELSNLIGVEGFDDEAIKRILKEHEDGGLREHTSIDQEKSDLEGRQSLLAHTNKIDCIEYWGTASGRMLKDYGFDDERINDESREYAIGAWLIGNDVIKAMLNYDPLGAPPYSKAGFIEDPDSFWGKGIPELVKAPQQIANSAGRALVNNVAIASGPQVEINVDRKAPGTTSTIYPWKVWETTNQGMADGKAVEFYMPRMVSDKLMAVYEFCSRVADEDSGVPRYAHGETSGSPDTVGATSMLMTAAARGIKNVIKNFDRGIIESSVQKQHYFNVDFPSPDDPEIVGDIKIVAYGTQSMIAKEQLAMRRKEILDATNNPTDLQIFGIEARKEMWKEVLKATEMDVDKIFSEANELEARAAQMQGQPMQGQLPPAEAPTQVDAVGNPQGGGDFDMNITPEGVNE